MLSFILGFTAGAAAMAAVSALIWRHRAVKRLEKQDYYDFLNF